MIPTSALAVIVFAASIGPGYVWVEVASARVPRPTRTALQEAAELVIVGGIASLVAFLVVLSLADWVGWFSTEGLAKGGTSYALSHSGPTLGVVVVALGIAYLGAWGVAQLRYRKKPRIIERGYGAWHRVFGIRQGVATFATVDLHDGTVIAGYVDSCTVDEVPPAQRDITLMEAWGVPIRIKRPGGEFVASRDAVTAINGADVRAISGQYFAVIPAEKRSGDSTEGTRKRSLRAAHVDMS